MRMLYPILAPLLLLGTSAPAQVAPTQHPTDANGPTPPASTAVDPMAPPATSRAPGSRPPADQNPTDANGPTPAADPAAPPAIDGAPVKAPGGPGTAGNDDVSAPSTHTRTPDQVEHKTHRRPHL